jgi:hypothetical protein
MNPAFDDISARPENQVFHVVFYPDRIYHAQYLNATRSPRYEYVVHEVRTSADITVLKGQVKLDGTRLSNFVRIEYRASRLVELSRQMGRLSADTVRGWVALEHEDAAKSAESEIKLHLCNWTESWQVEFWETLDPPANAVHDIPILDQMGFEAPITVVPQFLPAMSDVRRLRRLLLAFREPEREAFTGAPIADPQWDNNFIRSHQEPRDPTPSSSANTIEDKNYLVDFQRGFFVDARAVEPVKYRNAMMDGDNPERDDRQGPPDNVIEMRWLLQRELGAQLVFFHEVTIPPAKSKGRTSTSGPRSSTTSCQARAPRTWGRTTIRS